MQAHLIVTGVRMHADKNEAIKAMESIMVK
jgi:hypothetical protein